MAVALIICGMPPFVQLKGKNNARIGGHFSVKCAQDFDSVCCNKCINCLGASFY